MRWKLINRLFISIILVTIICARTAISAEIFGISEVTPPEVACDAVFKTLIDDTHRNTEEALDVLRWIDGGREPKYSPQKNFLPFLTGHENSFVRSNYKTSALGRTLVVHERPRQKENDLPLPFIIADDEPRNISTNYPGTLRNFPGLRRRLGSAFAQIQNGAGIAHTFKNESESNEFLKRVRNNVEYRVPLSEATVEESLYKAGYLFRPEQSFFMPRSMNYFNTAEKIIFVPVYVASFMGYFWPIFSGKLVGSSTLVAVSYFGAALALQFVTSMALEKLYFDLIKPNLYLKPTRVLRLLPEYTFDFFTHTDQSLFGPNSILGLSNDDGQQLLMIRFPGGQLAVYLWNTSGQPLGDTTLPQHDD